MFQIILHGLFILKFALQTLDLKTEKSIEFSQKLTKNKVCVYFELNILWQNLKELLSQLIIQEVVSIILPLIVHELLKLFLHVLVNRILFVKIVYGPEKKF